MREIVQLNDNPQIAGIQNYKCSRSSFAKILHKNNYRYGKINQRDAILFKKNVMARRTKYLETIAKYEADDEWDIVYQDETW